MDREYVRLDVAAAEIGTTRAALNRQLILKGITRYADPLDGRRYVILRADLARLLTPQPIDRPQPPETSDERAA